MADEKAVDAEKGVARRTRRGKGKAIEVPTPEFTEPVLPPVASSSRLTLEGTDCRSLPAEDSLRVVQEEPGEQAVGLFARTELLHSYLVEFRSAVPMEAVLSDPNRTVASVGEALTQLRMLMASEYDTTKRLGKLVRERQLYLAPVIHRLQATLDELIGEDRVGERFTGGLGEEDAMGEPADEAMGAGSVIEEYDVGAREKDRAVSEVAIEDEARAAEEAEEMEEADTTVGAA